MERKRIEISPSIVWQTVLILLGLWLLYIVRDILALLFISIILVSAMEPAVDWMHRRKIPRSIAVLFLYLLLFSLLGLGISFLIPPLSSQFQDFSQKVPEYFKNAQESLGRVASFFETKNIHLNTQNFFGDIGSYLSSLPQNIVTKTFGVFSGLVSIVVILSLAFYMSVEEEGIKKFIVSIIPQKHHRYAIDLTDRIKHKIGNWLLGQLFLMVIIFLLDWLGLYFIGVPYSLALGIFAGIMEIVPYVGPIISAVPGVILGFLVSPTLGFLAILVYVLSQQLENHVIVPQIMKKAVGLNPVAVILVLMVGASLGGVLGAILAIPAATAINLFIEDLIEKS